jgi:hypothetical protein
LPKVKSVKPPAWSVEEMAAGFIYGTATDRSWPTSISKKSPADAQRPSCSPATKREEIAVNIAKLPDREAFDLAQWRIVI